MKAGRTPARHRRWWVLAIAAVAIAIALVAVLPHRDRDPSLPLDRARWTGLDSRLEGAEAPVREAILAARDQALGAPSDAKAWGELAMVLDAHELLEDATAAYTRAEALAPHDWRWPYLRAVCLPEGDPRLVLSLHERALALAPENPPILLRAAQQCRLLGDHARARAFDERALALDAASSHARLGLARAAIAHGDLATAARLLTEAARLAPLHREVHALLATVHARTGHAHLAGAAEERALSLTGSFPIPDRARADVRARGRSSGHLLARADDALRARELTAARNLILRAEALRGPDPDVQRAFARLSFASGDIDGGIARLEALLRAFPDDLPSHRMLWKVLSDRSDPRALDHARKILEQNPGDAEVLLHAARQDMASTTQSHAVRKLLDLLGSRPYHRPAIELLQLMAGNASESLGIKDEVIREILERAAHDYLPIPAGSLADLARAQMALRDHGRARANLERARAIAAASRDQAMAESCDRLLRQWRRETEQPVPPTK